MQIKLLPIPVPLRRVIASFRLVKHNSPEDIALSVCLNGLPGIVFQHQNGKSPVQKITTAVGSVAEPPTCYIYGQMMHPGVMHYQGGTFTTIQVVLKPHGLQTLLGLNAARLTNQVVEINEFAQANLNQQLLEAPTDEKLIELFTSFMLTQHQRVQTRDALIVESLYLIEQRPGSVGVRQLLTHLHISERQFERRFSQAVGLSPQFYIRIKRFNQAIHLMQSGHYRNLTDVAQTLNYYDQSHFIRDSKAFSGISPKQLAQKMQITMPQQRVYAYS